jgi:hypothetical protein
MSVPVCEYCFKKVYELKLPYTYRTVVTCEGCEMRVLEHDEVAVKKAKIKRLIVEIEAYPMMEISKKEFIALIEDLKNG